MNDMPRSIVPRAGTRPTATAEVYEFDADRGMAAKIIDGLRDLREATALTPIWMALGWWDFKRQTRRTALGPLWSIIGTGITVAVLGYVYGAILSMERSTTFPYIAAGMVLWFFIAGCINGGLSVYVGARGVLMERNLPVAFSVFRFVWKYLIELIVKFVVFVLAALYVMLPMNETALLALPGLLLLVINGIWVVLVLGPVGARFRDVAQIVSPLMLIAFLASPVLWPQGVLGANEFIALINPFTHFLAVVRDPLLGAAPPMLSVIVTLVITAAGWVIAVATHCLAKDRIVFWI